MKTLILNGSPRKNGDTVSLIKKLTEQLNGEYTTEAKTELRELLQKEDLTEADEERIEILYNKYIKF